MSETRQLGQIITTLRTRSAANPALIFMGLCLIAGLIGIQTGPTKFQELFYWMMAAGIAVAGLVILFFTLFDRDRLHDEKHVERKLLIEALRPTIADASKMIEIDATAVLTDNPQLREG